MTGRIDSRQNDEGCKLEVNGDLERGVVASVRKFDRRSVDDGCVVDIGESNIGCVGIAIGVVFVSPVSAFCPNVVENVRVEIV